MKHAPLIAIIALACGLGGYTIGRQTAPLPFLTVRDNMFKARRGLSIKIRDKREVVHHYKKKPSPPRQRLRRPPRRPTTRPATTRPKAATKPTRAR